MQPSLGWAALSRNALARAEAQLVQDSTGVRDEVGVLALHFGYANRFFPGTSVQQTRLRYALFVPWTLIALMRDRGVRPGQALEGLEKEEMALALRLPNEDSAGTIGRYTVRRDKPVSIPPSQSYWTALSTWGVLNSGPGRPAPSRSEVVAAWRLWLEGRPETSAVTDDEHRRLDQPPRLFHADLPDPPSDFAGSGAVDFGLQAKERAFLRKRLLDVRREHDQQPAYLSALVSAGVVPERRHQPWHKSLRTYADAADRAALQRARHAAALSAVARAVYLAAVETLKDERDKASNDGRHRKHLDAVLDRHGANARKLRLGELAQDGVFIGGLADVLSALQTWLVVGESDPVDRKLHGVMSAWEQRRKGKRAKLPLTGNGREARAGWQGEKAGKASPIEYRWGLVQRLLNDLAET